jgi:LysR family glycine cleavage system transcriptional activator
MPFHLPSLNALRAFEATARNGSVSRAARELNVSAGAISRHIALLESDFGCQLLRREARGMTLTEHGEAYFTIVSQAFESIDQGSRHLRSGTHSAPRLSIVLYSAITTEWLAPRIQRFHVLHPSIQLHLSAKMQTANFDTDEVDMVVTAGKPHRSDLHSDMLFQPRYIPVCAPKLMADNARPRDLRNQNLLYSTREAHIWNAWFRSADGDSIDLTGGWKLDSLSLTYQAARSGAGVALGELFYNIDEIVSGRLVTPVPIVVEDGPPFFLSYRQSRKDETGIASFQKWILDQAQQTGRVVEAWVAKLPRARQKRIHHRSQNDEECTESRSTTPKSESTAAKRARKSGPGQSG